MPSRHCLSTGIVPLNLHVARLQAGANWKCIMMHTAYTARRQKATFTVACSTQTHLRVAKLEWWESCYLKKTCNSNMCLHLLQLVLSPSWPMCHLRDSRAFLWIQQQFCGEKGGREQNFLGLHCMLRTANEGLPPLPYPKLLEQNDASIKMLSILDVNTYIYV